MIGAREYSKETAEVQLHYGEVFIMDKRENIGRHQEQSSAVVGDEGVRGY